MSDFYTIWTNIGVAKLANALALGQSVVLTEFAVGDGSAEGVYNPTTAQTELKGEKFRAPINAINIDPDNPSWLVVEAVIPAATGGWYVREAAVFDDDGDMLVIAKYPETYKPQLESGVGKDLYLRLIMEYSNNAVVTLKIDPAVVLATRTYVDETVKDGIAAHDANVDAHPNFLRQNRSDTVTKGFWQTPVALAIEAGVATPDTVANNQWTLTIDEDVTIAAPDPIPDGGDGVLVLTIDGAGGHAISLDAAYRIAHGSINTDANAVNLIYMTINGDLVDLHISQRGAA